MNRFSEKRKEELLRRYGSKAANGVLQGPGGPPIGPGRPGRPGGPRGGFGGGKPKNVSATIRRLLAYLGRDKAKIIFVFLCVVVGTLANLGGSYILRPVINNLVAADLPVEEKLNNLMMGFLIMACVYLVGVVCSYLQQRIMIGVFQNALVKIKGRFISEGTKASCKIS